MMLGEHQLSCGLEAGRKTPQLVAQQALLKKLLAQPDRQRGAECAQALRCEGLIGFDQPLELEQRLVVEYDLVDFVEFDPAGLEE